MGITTLLKLVFFWLVSAAIVFGPYLAFVYGLPMLKESQGWTAMEVSPEKLAGTINPHYWILGGFYLFIAYFFTPSYDRENMGLFGSRWIDNPLTFEDDQNRMMHNIYVILLPGKLVWATVLFTWAVFRSLGSRSSEDSPA